MAEIWKYYDETHKVSNLGRVMWFDGKSWKFNKAYTQDGHPCVTWGHRPHPIKRLVAELFIDNPEGFDCVVNIDGDKLNCKADNLKWISRKDIKVYKPAHNSLQLDEAAKRIKEAKGDTYQMVGTYEQLCKPMRFKCGICGNEFDETPQHVIVLKEPCPHCRQEIKDRMKELRESLKRKKFKDMTTEEKETARDRSVYVYIFEDGYAYVGLTVNKKHRDYEHRCRPDSAVYQHSKETGLPIPEKITIADNLTIHEVGEVECEWIEKMSKKFVKLNKVAGGGLGGHYIPHTLEQAKKKLKKYRTRKQLRWHCRWAYELLQEHNELPPINDWQRYLNKRKPKRNPKQMTIGF